MRICIVQMSSEFIDKPSPQFSFEKRCHLWLYLFLLNNNSSFISYCMLHLQVIDLVGYGDGFRNIEKIWFSVYEYIESFYRGEINSTLENDNFCFFSFSSFTVNFTICLYTRHFDTSHCPNDIFWLHFASSSKRWENNLCQKSWLNFI